MKLLDSLLDAIVRLEGDALVMHVGEKPYVVTTSASMNAYRGPLAWGQVELSSRVLTPEAVQSMLGQILPVEQRQALDEIGAVEHEIASPHGIADRFTVVAARGGDDIWLELRRTPAEVTQPQPTQPEAAPHEQPAMVAESAAESATGAGLQPPPSQTHAPVSPGDAVVEPAYDGPQDERPEIEERIPVMDEAGSHEADRVEHLVISVGGAGTDAREHVPLDSVPNDAIEVVDDEPQGVPSEDEVDEMLAATAAALLTSGLESGDAGAERFDADSMHVVDEESPPPYDLTQVEALADADAAHARADEEPADEVTVVETDVEHLAAVVESEIAPEVMARDQVEEVAPAPQAASEEPTQSATDIEEPTQSATDIEEPTQSATDIEEPPQAATDTEAPPQAATDIEGPTPVAEAEPPAVEEPAQPVMFVEEPAQPVASIDEPAQPVTRIEAAAHALPVEEPAQPITVAEEPEQTVTVAQEAAEPLTPIEEAAQPLTPIEEAAQPHGVSEELAQPVMVAEQAQPDSTPEEPAAPATVVTEAAAAPRDDRAHVELPVEVPRPEKREHAREEEEEDAPSFVGTAAFADVVVPETAAAAFVAPAAPVLEPRTPVSETLHGLHEGTHAHGSFDQGRTGPADTRPGVVVPLARGASHASATLLSALRTAAARGASTVYLVAQAKPVIRVNGEIVMLEAESALSAADIDRLVADLSPHRRAGAHEDQVEWMSDVPEVGRVRCLTFRDHRGQGVIFRMDQAGLSPEVKAFATQPDGIVLIAGPHASGKSTLLNAFIDQINVTRGDHVISLESQVGFVHESRRSFISQRAIGQDPAQAAAAARAALREDPDVLVFEDLGSADVIAVALEAAESGRVVFASVSAPSATKAVEQLLEAFPPERRGKAAKSLAAGLRGVVSQVLVRRTQGGRTPAREVLLNTPTVAAMIREGRTGQLPAAFDAGRTQGMVAMTDALAALVREGAVQPVEAYRKSTDRAALLTRLSQDGVDTSFADRLV